jgi:hypothetical protein
VDDEYHCTIQDEDHLEEPASSTRPDHQVLPFPDLPWKWPASISHQGIGFFAANAATFDVLEVPVIPAEATHH